MTHLATKFLRLCLLLTLAGLGSALILASSLYLHLSPKLPSVGTLKTVKLQTPLRIYSQDMKLIGEFGEKRRTPILYSEIPPLFIQAILAAEDDGFYTHIGVDFKGLARAGFELITTGHIKTGGSTITMQLARNFFLTPEQSFIRKFNEILLALRIEDELEKSEIFTLYANKIYLGNRAYGIETAAKTYYGKSIKDLSLAQLAMIAGLPKAPSRFNPIINPDRAITRRNWILGRMYKLGTIERATMESAKSAGITAKYHGSLKDYDAPYAAEMARRYAVDLLGPDAYISGYAVTTTIDSNLQRFADQAVVTGLLNYDARHGYRGPETRITDLDQWPVELKKTSSIQGLEPAIVTSVSADNIRVLLTEGEKIDLSLTNTLKDLRRYISEDRRSARIKDLRKVFSQGDKIRVIQASDGEWRLAQIPDAQAALITLEPDSGAIKAMVGGFDFYQSNFNRTLQAQRQPGSNFKPFIYSAALEQGMTPATIINDAPITFDDKYNETGWRPVNSSGKFHGPTRLRKALYFSRNLVSIRILRNTGLKNALNTASKFGFIKKQLPYNLSLALGSHALKPIEIATGYAAFANGGYKIEPHLIDKITDHSGQIIFQSKSPLVCRDCSPSQVFTEQQLTEQQLTEQEHTDTEKSPSSPQPAINTPPKAKRILEPRIAFLMDSILKDVIKKGTATKARAMKRNDIAGKTGTTNGPRDAWFSGYNPSLVTTVWLGFDNNHKLGRREYGGSAALPIWINFMSKALANQPLQHHDQPQDLISVRIDPATGLRVSPGEEGGIFELFREENVPPYKDTGGADDIFDQDTPLPEDIF